jgi:hypothetical protein
MHLRLIALEILGSHHSFRSPLGVRSHDGLVPRTMSERRDPTFPSTGPPVPSSDDSLVEEWPKFQRFVPSLDIPDFLLPAQDGHPNIMHEFNLLDAGVFTSLCVSITCNRIPCLMKKP